MSDLRHLISVSVLGSVALTGVASAAEPGWPPPAIPGGWTVTVGVEGKGIPAFEGASQYVIDPVPVFSLRRSDKTARFRSPRDGASIALINAGGFYFGPVGKFRQGRDESESEELRGLGDVDWTLEVGLFAEYWPSDWLRGRVEVRRGFHGHEGIVADFSADFVVPVMERWTISGGPRLTLADTDATAPYFGINAAQSAASGLPAFDAKGGIYSVGAGLQARYQWSQQWAARSYVEYSRLMGDAGSSPLVTERGSANQVTFGLGVTYSFDIKLW
ncbi:MAG: MipA/OmpV family protein [Rhizobiales bacterium]|nr:MipA/OmpV family protein [Hyphomicrobiales bacterium]